MKKFIRAYRQVFPKRVTYVNRCKCESDDTWKWKQFLGRLAITVSGIQHIQVYLKKNRIRVIMTRIFQSLNVIDQIIICSWLVSMVT